MTAPYWLDPHLDDYPFPDAGLALQEPDGLLAVGGSLAPGRLLNAYRHGIFPWYSATQPILWWSPDPRSVLFPERLHLSRSLRKRIRQRPFCITLDRAFSEVISACAGQPRPGQDGTWITDDMQRAYLQLHKLGFAHSVEAWQGARLVGGLYGVAIGRVFFGESMFAHESDASKIAFVHLLRQLQRWNFGLIDCQVQTPHLDSLGAENIPRTRFIALLEQYCGQAHVESPWRLDQDLEQDPEQLLQTTEPDRQ